MAGTTRLKMAIEAVRKFDGEEVHLEAIKQALRLNVASDEGRIADYLRLLQEQGIMTEPNEFWKVKITIPK